MQKALPPLTWFRAFEAAARHLNFTAAAQELGLTQSAVSQQVRSLELRFGAPLFTRLPRGLALTDTGRRLLPGVAEAIGGLTRVTRAFSHQVDADTLVVAASISFLQQFVTNRFADFLAQHPGTGIRLRSTLWPDDFATSNADIEVRFGAGEAKGRRMQEFLPDHLVVVAAPGRFGASPTWQEITEAGVIASTGTSENWENWTRTLGLTPPRSISQTVDSYGLAMDMAAGGTGVALTSLMLAAPSLISGRLVIPIKRRVPVKDRFFITRPADQESVQARQFADWLMATVTQAQQQAEAIWQQD